jgi:hypothetical protein
MAVAGGALCRAHESITRRSPGSAPIHCYACGDLIRIDQWWLVRDEGAFHVRLACLSTPPAHYAISIR